MFHEAPPTTSLPRRPIHKSPTVQPPTTTAAAAAKKPPAKVSGVGGGKAPRKNALLPSRQAPYPAERPAVAAHIAPRPVPPATPNPTEVVEMNAAVYGIWDARQKADKRIKVIAGEPQFPELVDHFPTIKGNQFVGYLNSAIAVTVNPREGRVYWRDIQRAYDVTTIPFTHLKSFYSERARLSCSLDEFTTMCVRLKDSLDGIIERTGRPGFANRKK